MHENIEPAEVRRGRLNEVFNVAGFADIGRLGEDVVAEALSGGIEPRFIAGADGDAGALGQQRLGNGIADTAAASRDGGDPALETEVQVLASWRGGFGDGRYGGGGRAPADQRFLSLRVEEMQVMRVDGDLDALARLDIVAPRIHPRGQRLAAQDDIHEDLASHAFYDLDLSRHFG